MARVTPYLHSLNVGEVSRAGLARVDIERMRLAAEVQENLYPHRIGKGLMRPGTTYIGNSKSNGQARGITFQKSIDTKAGLELTNQLLRVRVDDELVTRGSVTSTVTSGDFSSSSGWTLATSGDATSAIADGVLTLQAPNRGGEASARQEVTTSNLNSEHALRIEVARGPVVFRIGGTEFGDEYLSETELETGTHSLPFTPTGIAAGADSYTKLLLHVNGVDASTTFTDSSPSAHTVTANGNAQIDTAQSKFGGAAGLFDGTGDYLSIASSADFGFGTGDFTIDFWLRLAALPGGKYTLIDFRPSAAVGPHTVFVDASGNLGFFNGSSDITGSGATIGTNVWAHCAVVRDSGTLRLFVNGVATYSAAHSIDYLSARQLTIGAAVSGTEGLNGWMDELRISKGIARWTTTFSPPAAAYGGAGDTYWLQFSTRRETKVIVDSVTVESAGTMELTAPWTSDELREIMYDQSVDTMFLAHDNWRQRKIERRGDTSWSLVHYKADDGPFTNSRTAKVRLKAAATRGNTTLTADANFFRSSHAGALFRLTHQNYDANFGLGSEESYTDAVRISGIGAENAYSVITTGTWVGTLTIQVSYQGPDTGFIDTATTITTNTTTNITPGTEYDNVVFWIRVGFKAGAYTSGSATVEIVYSGHSGFGIGRVTAYTSPTVVDIEVLEDFKNTSYTEDWQEGEWSDHRGWPSAVSFHDGRLNFVKKDRFAASESDDYYAFNLETEGDAGSIQRDIATSGAAETAAFLISLTRLIIGTESAEVAARSDSFDTPITPTKFSLKNAETVGAARVMPVKLGKGGFYVSSDEKTLHRLVYNFEAQDYDSVPVGELNEDYGGDGLLELAVQRKPEPYIWAVRNDGQCVIVLFSPANKIEGLIRHKPAASGIVESCYILKGRVEDSVYFWVKRTINGSVVRFLEKMALRSECAGASTTKLADAGVFNAGPVTTFTGLSHLEGERVLVWANGVLLNTTSGWTVDSSGFVTIDSTFTVASGQITLPSSYTNVFVGLPYTGRYKSAKLAYGAQGGTALLQEKAVHSVGLLGGNIHRDAIKAGPSFSKLLKHQIRDTDGTVLGDAETVKSVHDDAVQPLGGTWDTDSRLHFIVQPGHPACIDGIVMTVETK